MDSDMTVTATFAEVLPTQYSLTVNVVGSGSVSLDPDQALYDSGTVVELTAVANAGWQFSGWSGDLTGSTNPAGITMDGDKTVTATFVEEAADDYVAYLPFDDGTASDVSGNDNDGTVVGATVVAGQVGNALSFNGAADRVQIADSATLGFDSNRITLACWIYADAFSNGWETIMHRTRANLSWYDWQFYARASDAATANRPVFRIDWDGDTVVDANEEVMGNIVLSTNTWYFLAATYDGTDLKFYIDGALVGTTNRPGGTIPNGGRDIWIGGNDAWGEYFAGRIDEVFIYDRALSEAEIQALMTPGPAQ
jgi:uncharacterized repeat protein (TIGR02543 family)